VESTMSSRALTQLFEARAARFAALEAALRGAPNDEETRFKRRLVARARYSTWLDLEELRTETVQRPAAWSSRS
jgi:hypothetical protein